MNNILTKEEFIKIIDKIERITRFEEELYKLFYTQGDDASSPTYPSLESELIKVLNRMFMLEENEYMTDIEYFCFELDFGKEWEPGTVTCNGEDVDLSDSGKLYDWIIKDIESGDKNATTCKE